LLTPAKAEAAVRPGKRLEMGIITIKESAAWAKTGSRKAVLTINAAELKKLLEQDTRLSRVDIDVAKSRENTRIVRIVNTYEARARTGNRKGQFPFPSRYGAGHKRRQWQSRRAERDDGTRVQPQQSGYHGSAK